MSIVAIAIVCIASVHDGDTIRSCQGERIRLAGIDAPELRGSPRCAAQQRRRLAASANPPWCDFSAGESSRKALATFLRSGPVTITRTGSDRYGRTLAKLTVNGHDAGDYMVRHGFARWWR
jgi:endonuclease YncB( thermonuclease family)